MGKVEIVPNPKTGHFIYKIDNKQVPSVTTVISGNIGWNKRILLAWQAREFRAGRDPDKVVGKACDIGTLTHEMIEHHIYGQDVFDTTDVDLTHLSVAVRGLQAYKEWESSQGITYLESELRMCSEELVVGGTADCIAKIGDKTVLIDFKTSNNVYAEHIIQLGAYKKLIEETTDYRIDECIIVRISKGDLEDEADRVKAYNIDTGMVDMGLETFKQLRTLHMANSEFGKYLRKLTK